MKFVVDRLFDRTVKTAASSYLWVMVLSILFGVLILQDIGSSRLASFRAECTTLLSFASTDAATTSTTIDDNYHQHHGPAHFCCLCSSRTDPRCDATHVCDTIITYQDPDNQLLDLPNSTWTTARNFMYYLAKRRRRRALLQEEPVPSHYCFMDGDTKFSFDPPVELEVGKQLLLEKLQNETETDKIIVFNYRKAFYLQRYQFGADANVNCFADESIDRYLPYTILYERHAWSLSQRELWSRANTISPFAFKVYDKFIIWNPLHGHYPRNYTAAVGDLKRDMEQDGWGGGCYPPSCASGTNFTCQFLSSSGQTQHHSPRSKTSRQLTFYFNKTHTCGYMARYM